MSTPSVSSQPRNYKKHQGGDVPILDGRYDTFPTSAAVPVEVFHPAFAHFLALARDDTFQPQDDVVQLTADFIHSTSQIVATESPRQMTTRGMLSKLLGYPAIQTVQLNKSSADHMMPYSCRGEVLGTAALAIIEEKPELGTSGDGSVQGSFSFIQHWNDQRDLTQACFCPSFIISVAGPWLVVLGAIITSRVIVHRLTDYIWLGGGRAIDDARTLEIARILTGLREAIRSLTDFYASLSRPADDAARFYPLATSCMVNENGKMKTITWRYIRPLKGPDPSCVTFLAIDCEDEQQHLVVKFVERYGELVHKKLMAVRRAPELLYCGEVWPDTPERRGCGLRKMVVMKYVRGETIDKKYRLGRVPESVRKTVHEAITFLHQNQFVHGDVRCPNIIIEDDDGEEDKRVRLLDFDWSGA
ncbi:hypothetical protein BGW80DRAFT_678631 [Lactifluus volemus]|nr:hypothetical protein BGW80DRAFT_678631 [Lactifluus volemus]